MFPNVLFRLIKENELIYNDFTKYYKRKSKTFWLSNLIENIKRSLFILKNDLNDIFYLLSVDNINVVRNTSEKYQEKYGEIYKETRDLIIETFNKMNNDHIYNLLIKNYNIITLLTNKPSRIVIQNINNYIERDFVNVIKVTDSNSDFMSYISCQRTKLNYIYRQVEKYFKRDIGFFDR